MTETRYSSIQRGPAGTRETLRVMGAIARDGAHDRRMQAAAAVMAGESIRAGGDPVQMLRGLDWWIRQHFRYTPDGEIETVKTADVMLDEIQQDGFFRGDCDDVATFLASMAGALGMKARFIAIRTESNDPDFLHVFVEIRTPAGWVRLDPTVKPGLIHVSFANMVEYV
jgi:transglutaminase-like putative cysteine protease